MYFYYGFYYENQVQYNKGRTKSIGVDTQMYFWIRKIIDPSISNLVLTI